MKKTPGPFGQEGTRNIKIRGTILLIVSNLLTTKTGGFILSGKKSMKRIKFLLGVAGLVVTTGAAMADLCSDCMDYSSCMATMGYSGEITDTVSSEMCNQSYPDFSAKDPYIYRLGYSVGQTIKFDIDSGAFSEELAMLTGGIYIYTECLKRKYCTAGSDTQYFDLQAGFNNFKIIHFGGELRTCPDGGQVDWSNGAGATIGQCFVTSFNDDIGSGTYQNRCHYDMGIEM